MNHAPHPFSLRQLQYVVAVADLLSFRRAAEICGVSQPSLSAQLAQVEGMLGVQLFERNKRHVLLTPAGALLVDRARRLLVDADEVVATARRAADPLSGSLRVGVIPTVSPYVLPRLTGPMRSRFPALSVLWTEDKTPVLVERLAAGSLDAALLALEADLGEVEHAEICRDPFVLAMPRGHALAGIRGPVGEAELRGTDLLLLDEGHCFRTQALSFCGKAHLHEMAFRATSLTTLTQMVAGGAGVTLLPAMSVGTETRRAALSVRPLAEPAPHRTVVLIWRVRSSLREALIALATAMRSAMEGEGEAPDET